jgi:hypothetical protein
MMANGPIHGRRRVIDAVPWKRWLNAFFDYQFAEALAFFRYCVFRRNPSTDSGLMRPPIPIQSVH